MGQQPYLSSERFLSLDSQNFIDKLFLLLTVAADHRLVRSKFLGVLLGATVEVLNSKDVNLHCLVTLLSLFNCLLFAYDVPVEEYLQKSPHSICFCIVALTWSCDNSAYVCASTYHRVS